MNQLQRNLLQDFFNLILSHYPNLPFNLLNDFVNTYKETKVKKEKTPKTNKKNIISTNNANTDNDIISELVNLANGTDYGTPTARPVTTEAPGAPVKEKRKYNRKPKVQPVNETLEGNATDEGVVEPVVEAPSEKPVKEKKPRKPKASKEPVANNEPQQVSENNAVSDAQQPIVAEKPVKEKKPRKSNKKADTTTVEQPLEGTEINL